MEFILLFFICINALPFFAALVPGLLLIFIFDVDVYWISVVVFFIIFYFLFWWSIAKAVSEYMAKRNS